MKVNPFRWLLAAVFAVVPAVLNASISAREPECRPDERLCFSFQCRIAAGAADEILAHYGILPTLARLIARPMANLGYAEGSAVMEYTRRRVSGQELTRQHLSWRWHDASIPGGRQFSSETLPPSGPIRQVILETSAWPDRATKGKLHVLTENFRGVPVLLSLPTECTPEKPSSRR